jgi:shikimate kinase
MNIVLIGYRGTGKSTVGRCIAERLSWTFLDADEVLEQRADCTIREIFSQQGEFVFRDLESTILQELCTHEQQVLALGGGVVLREANRALLKSPQQRVVWLQADAETLFHRIHGDPTTAERRPALTNIGGIAEIVQLLAVREPLYRDCAEFTIATAERSPHHIADEIVSLVMGASA